MHGFNWYISVCQPVLLGNLSAILKIHCMDRELEMKTVCSLVTIKNIVEYLRHIYTDTKPSKQEKTSGNKEYVLEDGRMHSF